MEKYNSFYSERSSPLKVSELEREWQHVLEEERRSYARNKTLLEDFDRVEQQIKLFSRKSDSLKHAKHAFEMYVSAVYPKWNKELKRWREAKTKTTNKGYNRASSGNDLHKETNHSTKSLGDPAQLTKPVFSSTPYTNGDYQDRLSPSVRNDHPIHDHHRGPSCNYPGNDPRVRIDHGEHWGHHNGYPPFAYVPRYSSPTPRHDIPWSPYPGQPSYMVPYGAAYYTTMGGNQQGFPQNPDQYSDRAFSRNTTEERHRESQHWDERRNFERSYDEKFHEEAKQRHRQDKSYDEKFHKEDSQRHRQDQSYDEKFHEEGKQRDGQDQSYDEKFHEEGKQRDGQDQSYDEKFHEEGKQRDGQDRSYAGEHRLQKSKSEENFEKNKRLNHSPSDLQLSPGIKDMVENGHEGRHSIEKYETFHGNQKKITENRKNRKPDDGFGEKVYVGEPVSDKLDDTFDGTTGNSKLSDRMDRGGNMGSTVSGVGVDELSGEEYSIESLNQRRTDSGMKTDKSDSISLPTIHNFEGNLKDFYSTSTDQVSDVGVTPSSHLLGAKELGRKESGPSHEEKSMVKESSGKESAHEGKGVVSVEIGKKKEASVMGDLVGDDLSDFEVSGLEESDDDYHHDDIDDKYNHDQGLVSNTELSKNVSQGPGSQESDKVKQKVIDTEVSGLEECDDDDKGLVSNIKVSKKVSQGSGSLTPDKVKLKVVDSELNDEETSNLSQEPFLMNEARSPTRTNLNSQDNKDLANKQHVQENNNPKKDGFISSPMSSSRENGNPSKKDEPLSPISSTRENGSATKRDILLSQRVIGSPTKQGESLSSACSPRENGNSKQDGSLSLMSCSKEDDPVLSDHEDNNVDEESLLSLLRVVDDDIAVSFNTELLYRHNNCTTEQKLQVIRVCKSGESVAKLDSEIITMVILDQLPHLLRTSSKRCLISDEILINDKKYSHEKDIRKEIDSSLIVLWRKLFSHFDKMLQYDVMNAQKIAAIFAPCFISTESTYLNKAVNLVSRILSQLSINELSHDKSKNNEEDELMDDLSSSSDEDPLPRSNKNNINTSEIKTKDSYSDDFEDEGKSTRLTETDAYQKMLNSMKVSDDEEEEDFLEETMSEANTSGHIKQPTKSKPKLAMFSSGEVDELGIGGSWKSSDVSLSPPLSPDFNTSYVPSTATSEKNDQEKKNNGKQNNGENNGRQSNEENIGVENNKIHQEPSNQVQSGTKESDTKARIQAEFWNHSDSESEVDLQVETDENNDDDDDDFDFYS